MLKLHVQSITQDYCASKSKIQNQRISDCRSQLINEQNKPILDTNQLKYLRTKLKELEQEKNMGILIRSRAAFYENYEQPTHYFYSLENRNKSNTTLDEIFNSEGKLTSNPSEILKETSNFYQTLYSQHQTNAED